MPEPFTRATRSMSGSWLDRWLQGRKQHPQAFTCGVRVVTGDVPGLSSRWRYRDSAIDRLPVPGRVVLQHGTALTLTLEQLVLAPDAGPRPDLVVLTARDATTGAELELGVPAGEAVSFGVEL